MSDHNCHRTSNDPPPISPASITVQIFEASLNHCPLDYHHHCSMGRWTFTLFALPSLPPQLLLTLPSASMGLSLHSTFKSASQPLDPWWWECDNGCGRWWWWWRRWWWGTGLELWCFMIVVVVGFCSLVEEEEKSSWELDRFFER